MLIPSLVLLSITKVPGPIPEPAASMLIDFGYDVSESSSARASDGSLLQIRYESKNEPVLVDPVRYLRQPGVTTAPFQLSPGPSGFFLGYERNALIGYGNGRFVGIVPGFQSVCRINWTGVHSPRNGASRLSEPEREDFYLRLEAALRWMVANAELRRATTESGRVGGQNYTIHRNAAGKQHISARLFAQKEGLTLYKNKDDARFMLRTPKGDMIFPLGSNQVKVGDTWVKLNTILSAVDDEPYIPLELIERFSL